MLDKKNLEIVLHNDDIMEKIKKIAKDLDRKYEGQNPVIIGIMRGAVYFMTDLTSNMNIDLEIDIMCLSSYGESANSSGKVKILKDIDIDIENRPVIVLEDIVDTGTTLAYLKEYFKYQNAKSVETISIFQKDGTNTKGIKADVIGFVLPDFFLVGYGLDYANRYRHLKHVYKVLKI
ncbi:MAG: hypoxanthine phosphoribosyltransferase [Mycoplasmatales bacterium]